MTASAERLGLTPLAGRPAVTLNAPRGPHADGRMVNAELSYTLNKPEGLLAHYTTAEVAFEHVLPTGLLRMSPYRSMRDPVENKDIVPGTEALGRTPDNFDESYQATLDQIKLLRDLCRLVSFTHDADAPRTFGCCWARPRMWEQYADKHRGVCLLFDAQLLRRALASAFNERPLPHWFGDVRYTAAGIADSTLRNIIDPRIFDPDERPVAVAAFIRANSDDFFFLKSDDFKTEHEFRAVLMADDLDLGQDGAPLITDGDYVSVNYRDSLVAVIVGERFPNWQLASAKRAAERAGAMFGKVGWRQGRPIAFPPVIDDQDVDDGSGQGLLPRGQAGAKSSLARYSGEPR